MSVAEHGLPLLAVLALWFGSTGVVLWLDRRPPATFGRSLAWAGVGAVAGAIVLAMSVDRTDIASAYLALAAALAIWGWHELSFLFGIVSGPNRGPCPPHLTGWLRFRAAAATLIHHELALAFTAVLLAALAWGRANPTGAAVFALLFGLRLSAKLNIFLGVPAIAEEMLPPHLAYLHTYFAKAPTNPLLPVSLLGCAGAAAWFAHLAVTAEGGAAAGASILFGFAALGLVEHLFLVIPFREASLWRWARSGAE